MRFFDIFIPHAFECLMAQVLPVSKVASREITLMNHRLAVQCISLSLSAFIA